MSLLDKLNEIEIAKNSIKASLENKGKQPGNDIREYPALINSLDGTISSPTKVKVKIQELEPEDSDYQGFWIKSSTYSYDNIYLVEQRNKVKSSSINILRRKNDFDMLNPYKTNIIDCDIAGGIQYEFREILLTDENNNILYDIPVYYGNGIQWLDITPKKYIPLEYIESSDTQCLNTEYTPNNDTTIEIELSNMKNAADRVILTATNRWLEGDYLLFVYNNGLIWSYGENKILTRDFEPKHSITLYRGSANIDGVQISDSTTINSSAVRTTLHLFALPDKSRSTSYRLYSLKIYENSTLVLSFLPAYDNNEQVCLYEEVNNKFYYNSGSGSFIAGPEII